MKSITTLAIALLLSSTSLTADINLQNMYESAAEMQRMDNAMERGMQQHNQKAQPMLVETTEHVIDTTPFLNFEEQDNRYYLEKVINDAQHTKVKVSVEGEMVKIITITNKESQNRMPNGMAESSVTSESEEMLPIPYDSDATKLTKSYKNGLLVIIVPKKVK